MADSAELNKELHEDVPNNSDSENQHLQEMLLELQEEVVMHVNSQNQKLRELRKLVELLDKKVNEMHHKEFDQHEFLVVHEDFQMQKHQLRDFLEYLELHEQRLKELQKRLELHQQQGEQELLVLSDLHEKRRHEMRKSFELQEQGKEHGLQEQGKDHGLQEHWEYEKEQLHLQKCLGLMEQLEHLQKEVMQCMDMQAQMKRCIISLNDELQLGWEHVRLDSMVIPQMIEESRRVEWWTEWLDRYNRVLHKELKQLLRQLDLKHPKK